MGEEMILQLPLEVRALALFLDVDDRPAALVNWEDNDHAHGAGTTHIRYWNDGLERAGFGLNDLNAVVMRLREDGPGTKSIATNGEQWDVRRVADNWAALLHRAHERQGACHTSEDVGLDPGASITEKDKEEPLSNASLDWIRNPGPDISPWERFILDIDWGSKPVGPIESWPVYLRSYVIALAAHPEPRLMLWGPKRAIIYNEACVSLFGQQHPFALGAPAEEIWKDDWETMCLLIETAFQGKTSRIETKEIHLERNGSMEETYWSLVMVPMLGGSGVMVTLSESTHLVTGQRRRRTIAQANESICCATTLKSLWPQFLAGLDSSVEDVPYAMFYTVEDDILDETSQSSLSGDYCSLQRLCSLACTVGISESELEGERSFCIGNPSDRDDELRAACSKAWTEGKPVMLSSTDGSLPSACSVSVPGRAFGDAVKSAAVLPIVAIGTEVLGLLIIGISPRCPLNDEYNLYLHVLSETLTKAAALISLPLERERAQRIADDVNAALSQQLKITTLQIEKSEAKFSRMAKYSPTGMFVVDPNGRPLFMNDAYKDLISDTPSSINEGVWSNVEWADVIQPEDLHIFWDSWDTLTMHKTPICVEYRIQKPWKHLDKVSGETTPGDFWLLVTAFPEVESDGRVSAVLGWVTDISQQKFMEKVMAQRLEDALENKRQTENFIDMTSHEMRNPLSAILQSADSVVSALATAGMPILDESMILSSSLAEEIVDAAETIILCAQHQKRIVDDILTLSKLDASLLEISPEKVQPTMLVERALKMYESEIVRAGITARLVVEPSYASLNVDWVVVDSSRILQVIINLLTNAIKFSQYADNREVTIDLGVSREPPTGKHHRVQYIPVRQGRPSRRPRSSSLQWGNGESLYIQVAVTNTGQGLNDDEMKLLFQRFSQGNPKTYKQYGDKHGGTGLGLFVSRELCELQGGQIGVASSSGRTTFTFYVEAKRLEQQVSERPPMTRFLSAASDHDTLNRRGSVVTGSGNFERRPSKEASAPEHNSIREEEEHVPAPKVATESVKLQRTMPVPSSRMQLDVLVVEDNLVNQRVAAQLLKKAGCKVNVANHGLECLNFLEQSIYCTPGITPLSIILLDLEMPIMDGLTCIRRIRQWQKEGKIGGHVPVIAVTANARNEQISNAIQAGMDQVVTKPFRISELVPQMENLIMEVAAR